MPWSQVTRKETPKLMVQIKYSSGKNINGWAEKTSKKKSIAAELTVL